MTGTALSMVVAAQLPEPPPTPPPVPEDVVVVTVVPLELFELEAEVEWVLLPPPVEVAVVPPQPICAKLATPRPPPITTIAKKC
jgi:hypothetical protein